MGWVFVYLPLDAVLQPVSYLILCLEQEVLEGRRIGPADSQLVLQVPDAAHQHVVRGVRGHWRSRDLIDAVSFKALVIL